MRALFHGVALALSTLGLHVFLSFRLGLPVGELDLVRFTSEALAAGLVVVPLTVFEWARSTRGAPSLLGSLAGAWLLALAALVALDLAAGYRGGLFATGSVGGALSGLQTEISGLGYVATQSACPALALGMLVVLRLQGVAYPLQALSVFVSSFLAAWVNHLLLHASLGVPFDLSTFGAGAAFVVSLSLGLLYPAAWGLAERLGPWPPVSPGQSAEASDRLEFDAEPEPESDPESGPASS